MIDNKFIIDSQGEYGAEESYTLRDYLTEVKEFIYSEFDRYDWVEAEISRISGAGVRGQHCYMELCQTENNRIVAKIDAHIWKNKNVDIVDKFQKTTSSNLQEGVKVKIYVKVDFSEQYGISLNILDIDPKYTLGDLQAKKKETIERLRREGLIDRNKELAIPLLPSRIAIISAEGAAGYGDFISHLNSYDINFYTRLYEAPMQGFQAPEGIFKAFEIVNQHSDEFDVIVMIRGGGAELDLSCFDDYLIAYSIANANLPVICGIGHDRDTHVCDYVAAISVKTPTAVADFLVDCFAQQRAIVDEFTQRIKEFLSEYIDLKSQQIDKIISSYSVALGERMSHSNLMLERIKSRLKDKIIERLNFDNQSLEHAKQGVLHKYSSIIEKYSHELEIIYSKINSLNPQNILTRGYAVIDCDGQRVNAINKIREGARLRIRMMDGVATFSVKDLQLTIDPKDRYKDNINE